MRGLWLSSLGLKSQKRVWEKGGKQVPGYTLEAIDEACERHGVSGVSDVAVAA